MNGFLNINKPTGMSSAAVVGVIRRLTGEKRVGHAGTLDPEAAGILPIMIGRATRLFDYLADKEKEYVTEAEFGRSTDTQDFTGKTLETGNNYPDAELILEKLPMLTGDIRQKPSAYSAIKVGGRRLYDLARRGEEAEAPERNVHVERIELLREMPEHGFELRVTCGKGTYIRSICHDLGRLCGCPAHMRSLIRTRSGFFRMENAISLEEAKSLAEEGRLEEKLIPMDEPLEALPKAEVPERLTRKALAGAKLPVGEVYGALEVPEGQAVRVCLKGRFWGIAAREGEWLVWKAVLGEQETRESGQPA